MKKRKAFRLLGLVMIMVLLVGACSKKEASDMEYSTNSSAPQDAGEANYDVTFDSDTGSTDWTAEAPAVEMEEKGKDDGLSSTSAINSDISDLQPQDKIIRTFFLDVETQSFDSLITQIGSEINRLQGYIENSKVSGKRYSNMNEARYGSIVARIPSDKVDEFVNTVGDNANIVNKQESTDNVSLQYIEAESRIETLKIEQERLFAILEKEISLDNIIILESRLSDIRYELENYETKLRFYDNQVAYSTVTMSIQEVEKLTPVTEIKQTVGTRIKNGFSDTVFNISEGFKDFFVWFVVNLPYLLIWGIIIAIIVIVVLRKMKRQKAKEQKLPPPPISYLKNWDDNGQKGPDKQD